MTLAIVSGLIQVAIQLEVRHVSQATKGRLRCCGRVNLFGSLAIEDTLESKYRVLDCQEYVDPRVRKVQGTRMRVEYERNVPRMNGLKTLDPHRWR